MKIKTKEVQPVRSRSYLKHKLVSAAALLLVSSIMMVSTSYAWYVLSTAPEVSNIKTQVGANGALEIALLDENSWENLNLLDMGDIDESVVEESIVSAVTSNLTWGNLVDLDDASYGLSNIILNPARLYIEKDGSGHKVNSVLLKTPVYGEDGRVKGLDKTSAVAYTFENGSFSNTTGYGVRAIGTSASMSVFQLGMNAARSTLVTYTSAARTDASNTLNSTGGALAGIVVDYAVSSKTTGFTETDVGNILTLAEGLQTALGQVESALRQTFAGYITTTGAADEGVTAENYQAKLAEITDGTLTIAQLRAAYPGIVDVIPGIDTYISVLTGDQTKVAEAIADCEAMLTEAGTATYSWSDLAEIIYPLVDTDAMLVNGKNIDTLKSELLVNGSINYDKAFDLVSGGISITVPTGSGILSNIADFAGDYTATVPVAVSANLGGNNLNVNMDVLMTTATEVSPVYLTAASNGLKTATVAEASGSNSITDYYGYAIDLAFRTNAVDSNLLLQTEAANRIYDGDTQNPTLQGAGSYMSFTTTAGLSATKMVKLMSGIRVVLMDGEQNVLAIAALDTTLGKDLYTELDDEEKAATGMFAYLDASSGAYQNSDLIDAAAYAALPDTSSVTFNETTGKMTAKLYVYQYSMTESSTSTEDEIKYTGGLTLGDKVESGVITDLLQDVVQRVTALVYLDGSVVNNSTVAANSMHSMTGTLNLQFSSSAELLPMDNTQLRTDSSAVSYDELDAVIYQNGYLAFNGSLGKITEGYKLYEGSDGKYYYYDVNAESPAYVELTTATASAVLTPVTLTMTGNNTVAVGNTIDLRLTLSDSTLTVKNVTWMSNDTYADGQIDADDSFIFHVTGKSAGQVTCTAEVELEIGSGDSTSVATYTLEANSITVTVTD